MWSVVDKPQRKQADLGGCFISRSPDMRYYNFNKSYIDKVMGDSY